MTLQGKNSQINMNLFKNDHSSDNHWFRICDPSLDAKEHALKNRFFCQIFNEKALILSEAKYLEIIPQYCAAKNSSVGYANDAHYFLTETSIFMQISALFFRAGGGGGGKYK